MASSVHEEEDFDSKERQRFFASHPHYPIFHQNGSQIPGNGQGSQESKFFMSTLLNLHQQQHPVVEGKNTFFNRLWKTVKTVSDAY
jgi:hypothetical protein